MRTCKKNNPSSHGLSLMFRLLDFSSDSRPDSSDDFSLFFSEKMIKGAETPEHHGLIASLHLHAPHGSEPLCSPPTSPTSAINKMPKLSPGQAWLASEAEIREKEFVGVQGVLEESIPTHISAPHRLDSAIKATSSHCPASMVLPKSTSLPNPLQPSDEVPEHEWMGSEAAAIDNAFHIGHASMPESPGGWPRHTSCHDHVQAPPLSPQMSMDRASADKGDKDEFYI